jgi:hypothetical protein
MHLLKKLSFSFFPGLPGSGSRSTDPTDSGIQPGSPITGYNRPHLYRFAEMAEAKQQQVLHHEQELKALREELAASNAQEPHQRPHTQPSSSELQLQRPHTQPSTGAQQEALERQLAEKSLRITELETVVEAMKEGLATWTAQRDELKVQGWNAYCNISPNFLFVLFPSLPSKFIILI